MEIKLTQLDLAAMPVTLRRQLLRYVAGKKKTKSANGSPPSELKRQHLVALVREVSFHRRGRPLRAIMRRLAQADAETLTRRQLATALPAADRPALTRHVAMLNRLAAKASKQDKARLCQLDRAADRYTIHAATQKGLRELLTELESSGEHEEPLWE